MSESTLLLVTGPPGSGKSTVALLLARDWERAIHLRTDDFFEWIVSGYVEPWLPASLAQNIAINEAVAPLADHFTSRGYHVVVDGVLGPWGLESFRALDREIAYVVLRPDLDVARHRAANRGEHRLKDLAVVDQMHAAFADLGPLEHHVIDSTHLTAEETAAEVRRRLLAGAVVLR